MKVLLLGKSGLLGSEFLEILERENVDFLSPSENKLDLTNDEQVADFFAKNGTHFDKIINCAAYTNVEKAEVNQEDAKKINTDAVRRLASYKMPIIHFSSDYIFDAPGNMEIPEDYKCHPVNFLGETKLRAEKILEHAEIPYWNIRTSWFFGKKKENFITKILDIARSQDKIQIIGDQIGRPTYAKDLAEYVFQHFVLKSPKSGHYHLQNTGRPVSWADIAEYLIKKKAQNDSDYKNV